MQKFKRVASLIIVILWLMLIAATFICAFIPDEDVHNLFMGLMFTDIGLPVVAYAMMLIAKILKKKS